MKKFLLLLLMVPFSVLGQTEKNPLAESNFSFGIVPQYTFTKGLRADLDFRLNNKNNWLVVAPQLYVSNEDTYSSDYNSMWGAGIELQHKIFMKKDLDKRGIYFAYGPTFHLFSVKDEGLTAQAYEEDGGNYIGLEEGGEMTTHIYKFGGNFIIGAQIVIGKVMYIDPYIGIGMRFSFDDQSSGLHGYYNEWWSDMGYSGTLMVGGVRFGLIF